MPNPESRRVSPRQGRNRGRSVIAFGLLLAAVAGCGGDAPARRAADETPSAPASVASTAPTTVAPTSTTAPAVSTTTAAAPRSSVTTKPALTPAPTSQSTAEGLAPVPKATVVVAAAPTDPAALDRLTDALVADETKLRSPATPAEEMAALAHAQQAAYRAISARPEVLPRVLARAPEALRPVIEANVTAGAELRALTKPRTELPPWRIVTPPPQEELEGYYRKAESLYGVPWQYLAAVHLVETRMGRIRGTSTAGAQGPMQFLPSTWSRYGEGGDINDAHDAILAAGRYLKAAGAPGDLARALYAYNHSDRYVRAVTHYARQIEAEPRAYLAYWHWQVYYITTKGDVWLEEGYAA